MNSLLLFKGLLNKENYNRYRDKLEILPEEKSLFSLLDSVHSLKETDITMDEVFAVSDEFLHPLLIKAKDLNVSNEILSECVRIHFERLWAYKKAQVLVDVFEGKNRLSDALQELSDPIVESNTEDPLIPNDLKYLKTQNNRNGGLQWRLNALKEHAGGLHKGDFTIVVARPETGKTTFCASEFGYMATQCVDRGPVLWFNNEERGTKVLSRIYQSVLGVTVDELFSKEEYYQEQFIKSANITLYDKGIITRRDVEKYVKSLQPSLIVFDQIDKIKGFKGDRPDLAVGQIYIWARELAKEYCPVVGVCQASASAEDKKWLSMEDMAESKTAKPAEGDLIIGIGKTESEWEFSRGLHLIKNKLTGSHEKITCIIQPEIARYRDSS